MFLVKTDGDFSLIIRSFIKAYLYCLFFPSIFVFHLIIYISKYAFPSCATDFI